MEKGITLHIRYRDGFRVKLKINLADLEKLSKINENDRFMILDREDIGKMIFINCNEIQSIIINYGQKEEK